MTFLAAWTLHLCVAEAPDRALASGPRLTSSAAAQNRLRTAMHHFLIVLTVDGHDLSPELSALIADPSPGEVPFEPVEHHRWVSPSGSVRFSGWSREQLGWASAEDAGGGFAAVAGDPLVTVPADRARVLDAQELLSRGTDVPDLIDRLDGMYALVVFAADGSGLVVNDPFGLHALYRGGAHGVTIVSNRSRLVAAALGRLCGRPVGVDEEAAAWVAFNGHMLGERTAYSDVELPPWGEAGWIESGGRISWRLFHARPWSGTSGAVSIDELETRMSATIRAALSAAPEATESELTGGRDSRMVLDLAARAGFAHDLSYYTRGRPTSSDVVTAQHIAEELGLTYERRNWMLGDPTLENLVRHVVETSGQLGKFGDNIVDQHDGITLSGLGGESLRTNYPKQAGHTSVRAVRKGFRRQPFGLGRFLHRDAARTLKRRARAFLLEPLDEGAKPEALFDIFYVRHRMRRWIGDRPDRFQRHVFPLYSPLGFQHVLTSDWEARAEGRLHDEIRQRAALPLDHIGFSRPQSWHHRPGEFTLAQSETPRSARTGSSSRGPQMRPTKASSYLSREQIERLRRESIREALAFDPDNPAFDVVDRTELSRAADRIGELKRRERTELDHAVTFVLWLGLARPDVNGSARDSRWDRK